MNNVQQAPLTRGRACDLLLWRLLVAVAYGALAAPLQAVAGLDLGRPFAAARANRRTRAATAPGSASTWR